MMNGSRQQSPEAMMQNVMNLLVLAHQHGKVVMPGDFDQQKREAEKQKVKSCMFSF